MGASGLTDRTHEWAAVGAVAAIVFVHLGLLIAAPGGLDLTSLVVLEAALLALLLGLELLSGASATDAVPLVATFVCFFAMTWGLVLVVDSLAIASILLSGMSILLMYGLHRYELVFLGMVNA
ncbi:MAG: hypothetical protein RI560_13220 [Natronomonas sp.]|uniref:DUF8163 domain-containing protein n=1 Tax=Natronomonas salsuginis TaxID=2217661 RepID=A0A4U5JBB2_9EURY|nr:hypothetical protein [Natronomonas salsuginis]MDR9382614.1 hypothetical protein [Natronomonas sp.]TKR25476.1 hypothetical protein DM868_08610 [Natronomonas salsuginis]